MRCFICSDVSIPQPSSCCRTEQINEYCTHQQGPQLQRQPAAAPQPYGDAAVKVAHSQPQSIRALAQRKIAEAEAAIAAAEQSAMQAMHGERFSATRVPPWAPPQARPAPSVQPQPLPDVQGPGPQSAPRQQLTSLSSFKARLQGHEEHLSTLQRLAQGEPAQPQGARSVLNAKPHAPAMRQRQQVQELPWPQAGAGGTQAPPPPPWAQPSFLPSLARHSSGACPQGAVFSKLLVTPNLRPNTLHRRSCASQQ
jgi:hypothetical protein